MGCVQWSGRTFMPTRTWEATELLSKVTAVVPGIIYVFNQKTQSNEYSNRSLGDILGYTGAEIAEMGDALFPDLCHPEDLPIVGAHFEVILGLADGAQHSVEYRMRHKHGHWVWLRSIDTVYARDEAGAVISHIGVATDITFQKRSAAEIETIFNAASSGIVALGNNGQILRMNQQAQDLLRIKALEVPMPWPETAQFVDHETMRPLLVSADPIQRVLSGHDLRGETHLLHASAKPEDAAYVRLSNSRPADGDSDIHTVLVIDDVSGEVRDRQVIERRSRLDALGQLTGGIAHDFNNLLGALLYLVDLAQKTEDPETRENYLTTATQSIESGAALTGRLLAFAKRQPSLASVRSTQKVFDEFELLVRPILQADLDIEFNVEEPGLRHLCDQGQLEGALMNLVLNARDAMRMSNKGDRISIAARAVRSTGGGLDARQDQPQSDDGSTFRYVEISVSDNGPGMDEETLKRSIDPFFSTKSGAAGTGLGLAIVYGFVTQAQGDLRIYSEEGVGTTVRMTLPRGTEEGTREQALPPVAVETGNGERILLVEDEITLLNAMTETLEDLGYEVITATSGQQALDIVQLGEAFELLVTDVVMPGPIGGFELARKVRFVRPEVPVLYTSGYTGFTALEMGQVQAPLLQKPTRPEDLATAVTQALSGGNGGG
jgi:PAS domain S-box-containing protein